MKTLLPLFAFLAFAQISTAQYCGASGPSQCVPAGQAPQAGLYPASGALPPFINGQTVNTSLEFLDYDTIVFAGTRLTVNNLTIDTITNLPAGLCWSTNKANNTFSNMEDGCILFTGTTCAPPGQYKLYMIVTVDVGIAIPTNADAAGLNYYVRVNNYGEAVTPVDTTQTATNPVILYGPTATCQAVPLTADLGQNQTVCANSSTILNTGTYGGTPPYTYYWQSTGSALSCNTCATPSVTIGQNSTFTAAVTDAANHTVTTTVTYSVSGNTNNMQLGISNTNISCTSHTDTTTVTVTNGTAPYNINWGDGITSTGISSPATHNYSQTGAYAVLVTDNQSCATAAADTVLNTGVNISFNNISNPNCWGSPSGAVGISVSGGTAPYTYSWNTGATTSTVTNIIPGYYWLTVTDVTSCSASASYYLSSISDPWGFYAYAQPSDANCNNNGTINAAVYGGIAPYHYNWSNGSTAQASTGLSAGPYQVTVTDSAGCSVTATATVQSSCFSLISGVAFIDTNNNCIFDAGETPLSNLCISATVSGSNTYYGYTDAQGSYAIQVADTGTLTITTHNYYGICGNIAFCGNGTHTLYVPVLGDTLSNNNIGFTSSGNFDLGVHPGWSSANPGFTKEYWLWAYNQSPIPVSGNSTVVFTYDPNLTYLYSDVVPTPVNNSSEHTLTWTLSPSELPSYGWGNRLNAHFQVPETLSLTSILQTDFKILPITGDCDSTNNHFHFEEMVIGSHDPNEKDVYPANSIATDDSVLTYTIHFQNDGTDSTHFIIVKDTLSDNLDPATVRTIASSAKYSSFSITGRGILTWVFNPYRLVDSLTNPEGSKGFVTFQVQKKNNLPIGTIISNTASIYFDYNEPVVTNTVADTVANPTGIAIVSGNSNVHVKAYPNPFTNATNIEVTGLNQQYDFELFDVTGRLQRRIPSINTSKFELQRDNLPAGIYLYRIAVSNGSSAKQAAYGKLVIE